MKTFRSVININNMKTKEDILSLNNNYIKPQIIKEQMIKEQMIKEQMIKEQIIKEQITEKQMIKEQIIEDQIKLPKKIHLVIHSIHRR